MAWASGSKRRTNAASPAMASWKHLDGHVAFDVGLDRPEDDAGGTVVDLLQEPVAAEGFASQIEPGILLQDPFVKPQELRGGIETKLVREDLSGPLEGAQRLGLAPVSVVRQHQEAPEAFAPRMPCQQGLQFPDRSALDAARQQTFDPDLLRLQAKLIEPSGLGQERGLVGEVGESRPPPQSQGIVERADRDGGIHGEGLPRVPHELVEPRDVQLGVIEPQAVAGCLALDPVAAERLAQVRDIGLDDVPGLLGRLVAPDSHRRGYRRERAGSRGRGDAPGPHAASVRRAG